MSHNPFPLSRIMAHPKEFYYIGYNIYHITNLNYNVFKILIPTKMREKNYST